MARVRRPFLVPAILLLAIAGSFLFLALRAGGSGFAVFDDFFRPRRDSTSWSILEEIRDLESLETAAYDMKVVFPFDFAGDEPVNWTALKIQYDHSPDLFLAKTDPGWHPGGRLPPEWDYAELYDLCRRVGIDPGRPDHRFIVMSVSVHAGIDLEAWRAEFAGGDELGEVNGISITVGEDGRRTLSLPPLPVEVSSFIIEDRDSTTEGFPDVPLSPDEWRRLVDGLEPQLREMALGGGLPERAAREGQAFLEEMFKAAGYDDVRFTGS